MRLRFFLKNSKRRFGGWSQDPYFNLKSRWLGFSSNNKKLLGLGVNLYKNSKWLFKNSKCSVEKILILFLFVVDYVFQQNMSPTFQTMAKKEL